MFSALNIRFSFLKIISSSIFLVSMFVMNGAAMADRPEWAGSRGDDNDNKGSQKNKHKHEHERGGDRRGDDDQDDDRRHSRQQDRYQSNRGGIEIQLGGYFGDTQRSETHEYYRERAQAGHCPPGLAKKHNGCVPPGQARKWTMGHNLPRDVAYEPIEPGIQIKLGVPPEGHKFVRVASDILLIAVGTGMVMDAIQDLGQ